VQQLTQQHVDGEFTTEHSIPTEELLDTSFPINLDTQIESDEPL